MLKNRTLIVFFLAALVIGGMFIKRNFHDIVQINSVAQTSSSSAAVVGVPQYDTCLAEDETASYTITNNEKMGQVSTANIVIHNKVTQQEVSRFTIEVPTPTHYHPIEIRKCSIYAFRSFGYNYKTRNATSDYKFELWKYKFNGSGESLILLSGPVSGSGYQVDFNLDPDERYLVLIRGYLGSPDHALVIKDLRTMEDKIVLFPDELKKNDPSIQLGDFDFLSWTPDGRYFWGTLFDGALDIAYIRIDTHTWQYEVYPAPMDIPAGAERGTSLAGYLAYADFQTFFGIDIVEQDEQEQFKKEGRVKHLYLYNFRTKEKILLATTKDPAQRFNIHWVSDTQLEYTTSSGAKKVYEIPTNK